jgi:hypothetical protein
MNTKNIVTIILIIAIIPISIFGYFRFIKNSKTNDVYISKDILSLTQPVLSIIGKIESINENEVTIIKTEDNLTVPVDPSESPSPSTTPLTYIAQVTDNTQIKNIPTTMVYFFRSPAILPQQKLDISYLQVGQQITIDSTSDLRTIKGNKFEASVITLPQIKNMITGVITSIEGDVCTLKAFPPTGLADPSKPLPDQIEYKITITQDTEISRMAYSNTSVASLSNPGKPQLFSLSDLKKDMQISAFADQDLSTVNQFKALRIEPLIFDTLITPTINPIPVAN